MPSSESVPFDAFDLARRQGRLQGSVPLAWLTRLAGALAQCDGAVEYSIDAGIDERGRPGARLSLSADLRLVCQRCGAGMPWRLERTVDFRLVRSEAELDEVALDDDALEAIVAAGSSDAVAWIEDEAILSLPLVARHSNCRTRWHGAGQDRVDGQEAKPGPVMKGTLRKEGKSSKPEPFSKKRAFAALAAWRPKSTEN